MSELDADARIERLAAAADEVSRAREAVEDVGRERVERLADAYERFDDLLDRYREPASGSGRETFKTYVEFESKLEEFVSGLPEDLTHREAFEAAESILDRRRLEEGDFDRAREALEPAREVAGLIGELEAARERFREARRRVEGRRGAVVDRLEEVESLLAHADLDFDAPVERLREPIGRYDDAVADAFDAFLAEAPARRVLDVLEAAASYPLVEVEQPPDALASYLRSAPPGEEPIPTLLEWTEWTASKLDHYVDDPRTFRARVGGNRTVLRRLDGTPFQVGWPPPRAEDLRFRTRELVPVVSRFAPEDVLERLQVVRKLPAREDYERLRRVAAARASLDEADRERLRDGSLEREAERLREERDRLETALEEHSDQA